MRVIARQEKVMVVELAPMELAKLIGEFSDYSQVEAKRPGGAVVTRKINALESGDEIALTHFAKFYQIPADMMRHRDQSLTLIRQLTERLNEMEKILNPEGD